MSLVAKFSGRLKAVCLIIKQTDVSLTVCYEKNSWDLQCNMSNVTRSCLVPKWHPRSVYGRGSWNWWHQTLLNCGMNAIIIKWFDREEYQPVGKCLRNMFHFILPYVGKRGETHLYTECSHERPTTNSLPPYKQLPRDGWDSISKNGCSIQKV